MTRRVHRLPIDLRRAFWFERGYRDCLRHYTVDAGCLQHKAAEPATSTRSVGQALRMRASVARTGRGTLTLPVTGGAGGLLTTAAYRRLTSILDPAAVTTHGHPVRRWLERRQARRSALVLVPDRATGMRFAGLWRLDLARIRVTDLQRPLSEHTPPSAAVQHRRRGPRPWHAT